MELRHLRYFAAVAEELNMSRAAAKLHISQPPLSRQIRDLEDELGTALFDRTSGGLRLTGAGESFLKEAKGILSRARRAAQLVRAEDRGEAGSLVIAYRIPFEGMLPTRVLRKCRKYFPSMELVIRDMTTQEQIMALLENQIDLGYIGLQHLYPELKDVLNFESVRKTELVVALPSGHPLTKKRKLRVGELSGQSLILVERPANSPGYDRLVAGAARFGLAKEDIRQVDTTQNLLRLIAAGFGVSLVPDIMKCNAPQGVVFRPLRIKFEGDWSIAWRKDNKSPLLEKFLDLLREDIKKNMK